jgi:RNA polymerase sigma factor (sigma-70 family)
VNDKSKRNLTDQYLVEKVLHGDRYAFRQVIKNTEGLVTLIIFKMISNTEDRKDLAQDTYLKAFKNLSGFKFQSKLSTWIGQITFNTCINFLEKKKLVLIDNFYEENNPDNDTLEKLSKPKVPNNEPENFIFQKELSKILQSEIEKLSPVFKTLVTLFHKEELSYAEISEITQIPEGTVKNYLFRARKVLKENLLVNYKKEEL